MNLVKEIKDLKFNYKPNLLTLEIIKSNDKINVDLIYSTENQYILDTKDVDTNIVGEKRDFNIITEKNNIVEHLTKTYILLEKNAETNNFEKIYSQTDWLTLYICSLLNLTHVKIVKFYFYKKYTFVNIKYDDGNFETFIHLNIFFNQELDMDELKKNIEPFGQDEINYIQSSDYENCATITQIFQKDFSIFPFEELYQNILEQNKKEENKNE